MTKSHSAAADMGLHSIVMHTVYTVRLAVVNPEVQQ